MTDAIVYLDFASTTPLAADVAAAMHECTAAENIYGNAASQHPAGRKSALVVDHARQQVATLLNVEPERLIWTSGATESNNLAIQGVARTRQHRGKHLITMLTEHKAVVDTFRALEREGYVVTWLAPGEGGLLAADVLADAIRADTQLVSIMHINNETGITQNIHELGHICRERGVSFHVDAAQSTGKVRLDLSDAPIDLLSLTGHKFYGPQGIGALYIADFAAVPITPLVFGGGQERRLRPGTLPVPLIVGLGRAAEIAHEQMDNDLRHLRALNRRLWKGIADVADVLRNGSAEQCFPGILNVSVADVNGESLMLGMEPICVSSGSACNSTSGESSYVLRALGRSDREADGAVRFSFGRTTTNDDIDAAIERYRYAIKQMRSLAPGP
ncbi:MAG: aminotransferase class V-fold PLP-dependent enzyme [Woeseia sp.]|jgi:cysteine desulfurase|nr:aminotransferase class V-fold PLP-dependent enzyme [Woeseia sp.]MBT6209053.1 aminotransferase class V-fold PLP-dependent enzyme [Woeseia sp.]